MKVLSKYFKVALCFMAFALCSFMFAFAPTFTAVEAASMAISGYQVAINALKMPTEEVDYENEEEFNVPLLSSGIGAISNPTGYTIRVIDPAGYKHDYVVGSTSSDAFFGSVFTATEEDETTHGLIKNNKYLKINAKNDGFYKVIYIVTEGTGEDARTYYSNTYTVSVTNVSYELDFSTAKVNSNNKDIDGYTKNLIPTKMAVSNTAYELPVAYAKISGKELSVDETDGSITNDSTSTKEISIKVTKDGAPQKENDTANNSIFSSTTENGVTKYFITPSAEGVYTVEYSYENSANRPTKTFTITVEEGYVPSALKLASTPTMPTIELGKEITLPKITVNAGDEKNVDVNVTSIKIEKEGSNGAIAHELTDNNFKFVMSPENFGVTKYDDMVGNYRITYTVKGAYETQTLTEIFSVNGVTASSKPTVKLAYNYDKTQLDKVVFGAETELKAEYGTDGSIVLPAVYVEDSVTNFDDFIIVRAIRKNSTYYYVDNVKYDEETGELTSEGIDSKYKNAALDSNYVPDPTKAVKFRFDQYATNIEGNYTLEYRVITKQVKERENNLYVPGTSEKYSFKVVAPTAVKTTTPEIEITNLKDSSVKNTDNIVVKLSSKDDVDTRLKNAVFTYKQPTSNLTTGQTFESVLKEVVGNLLTTVDINKSCHVLDDARLIEGWESFKGLNHYFEGIERVEENETKNNFDLNLKNKTNSVEVVAVTINDVGNIATDSKTLEIKDTNDQTAPVITISEVDDIWKDKTVTTDIAEFKIGQGKEVTLPTVYVNDKDKTLSLNVMYYIDSPENSYGAINYKSPTGKRFYYGTETILSQPTEVQYIDGGTITTSQTGIYYVAYTATDVAGNTSVMYFTFEVVDTSKPILSVQPVSDDVTISGNTVTGAKGTVIDFETTLRSSDGKNDYTKDGEISITIDDNGKSLDYQPSGDSRTSYVFNDYGTYTVKITGKYVTEVNGEDVTLEADIKTVKIVIEKQEIKWLGEFDVPTYATTKQEVKLPDIAASNGAVVKVTYLLPNTSADEAIEAEKVTDANGYTYWTFTTNETSKGTYTVTYTATTDEDVLTKTVSIKVGDNVAPTMTFNKGELTQDLVYDGTNDIEYVLVVDKSINNKSFVVKAINNGKEIYNYNIGLVISDRDDSNTENTNMSWTNLTYELTGDNVTKGNTSTSGNVTTTQYLISGTGKCSLKLTVKDSYDNERTATIDFKVVEKASTKENKDTVVGAVLIVISLILLAGVILFFTFTGKKGNASKTKTKKEKVAKVNNKPETKEVEEVVEEKAEEVVVEEVKEEPKTEATEVIEATEVKTEEVETKVDEEPKSGDVE